MKKTKVLIVDDDPGILYSLSLALQKEGYEVITASDGKTCLTMVEAQPPDIIYLDIAMPELDGLEALRKLKERQTDIPVIVITGHGTMQNAIKAVQLGAYEYMTKPLDREKIRLSTQRALENLHLKRQLNDLKAQIQSEEQQEEIIGTSQAMQEVYKRIGAVSQSSNLTTVLIEGESGTGKELVARAIHRHGPHPDEPFVAINCTVLPEDLLASELFGHEKGAFTGAVDQRIGKLEFAGSGTVFLDEIGDMPPDLQKKLLRVLQERQFQRLGSNRDLTVNARFITATNKNLENEVAEGRFREDLYYRLNVVNIKLPPLRERPEDIPLLAEYFLKRYSRHLKKNIRAIAPETLRMLQHYSWPGNVRELENVIHSFIALEKGEILLPSSLPLPLQTSQSAQTAPQFHFTSLNLEQERKHFTELFESQFTKHLLQASGGDLQEAARLAGVTVRTVQRLVKKYGKKIR